MINIKYYGGDYLKDRLKLLRKEIGLTQEEFGERIGIKRNTVATYEIGRNEPIDGIIFSICREFSVNEHWLRTGEGEMFNNTETYSLDELIKTKDITPMEEQIIRRFISLDDKTRHLIVDNLAEIFAEIKKESQAGKKTESRITPLVFRAGRDEAGFVEEADEKQAQVMSEVIRSRYKSDEPLP